MSDDVGPAAREALPPGARAADPSASGPTSTRRRLLGALGGAGVALLAGCTDDVGQELPPNRRFLLAEHRPELPVDERLDVLSERIVATAGADVDSVDSFVAALEGYALEVHDIGRERGVLVVDYENLDSYAEGTLHDVGLLAGAFAAFVAGGFDGPAAEITILDAAPASFGVAEVDTRWAAAYNDGDLTVREYAELVAGTVESTRHEPAVEVDPGE